jgi:cation diffusion facilitator family transporter
MSSEAERTARRLVYGALGINIVLLSGFAIAYWITRSQLVLAQGADSLMDLASGTVLSISAVIGSKPRDDDHQFGHARAEPVGALVTAVLAGALAFEVARSAAISLWEGETPQLSWVASGILGAKLAAKLVLYSLMSSAARRTRSSALEATKVDTRNDLLATSSSLVGVGVGQAGLAWVDAALAIPIALYIAYSGVNLARENLRYLMGESPGEEVHRELCTIAESVRRVERLVSMRAHFVGQYLHVDATVLVGAGLDATEVHDLAVDVKQALERHPLVELAFVHCDTEHGKDH